jgi:hypothetical protein
MVFPIEITFQLFLSVQQKGKDFCIEEWLLNMIAIGELYSLAPFFL